MSSISLLLLQGVWLLSGAWLLAGIAFIARFLWEKKLSQKSISAVSALPISTNAISFHVCKRMISSYIEEILPIIFADTGFLKRLYGELCRHHRFVRLFAAPRGELDFRLWSTELFRLLTIITFGCCFIALFLSVYIVDDSDVKCERLLTERSCGDAESSPLGGGFSRLILRQIPFFYEPPSVCNWSDVQQICSLIGAKRIITPQMYIALITTVVVLSYLLGILLDGITYPLRCPPKSSNKVQHGGGGGDNGMSNNLGVDMSLSSQVENGIGIAAGGDRVVHTENSDEYLKLSKKRYVPVRVRTARREANKALETFNSEMQYVVGSSISASLVPLSSSSERISNLDFGTLSSKSNKSSKSRRLIINQSSSSRRVDERSSSNDTISDSAKSHSAKLIAMQSMGNEEGNARPKPVQPNEINDQFYAAHGINKQIFTEDAAAKSGHTSSNNNHASNITNSNSNKANEVRRPEEHLLAPAESLAAIEQFKKTQETTTLRPSNEQLMMSYRQQGRAFYKKMRGAALEHRLQLHGQARIFFDEEWGFDSEHSTFYTEIVEEIAQSIKRSEELIERMKLMSDDDKGMLLMQQWLADISGPGGMITSKVIELKFESEYPTYPFVAPYWQYLSVAVLVLLNGAMLYQAFSLVVTLDNDKWQQYFCICCSIQVFVEIVVVYSVQWFVSCVLCPNSVYEVVRHALWTFEATVYEMKRANNKYLTMDSANNERQKISPSSSSSSTASASSSSTSASPLEQFNAPSFFYASARVADAFPWLLESSIVKSGRSVYLSNLSRHWRHRRGLPVRQEYYCEDSHSHKLGHHNLHELGDDYRSIQPILAGTAAVGTVGNLAVEEEHEVDVEQQLQQKQQQQRDFFDSSSNGRGGIVGSLKQNDALALLHFHMHKVRGAVAPQPTNGAHNSSIKLLLAQHQQDNEGASSIEEQEQVHEEKDDEEEEEELQRTIREQSLLDEKRQREELFAADEVSRVKAAAEEEERLISNTVVLRITPPWFNRINNPWLMLQFVFDHTTLSSVRLFILQGISFICTFSICLVSYFAASSTRWSIITLASVWVVLLIYFVARLLRSRTYNVQHKVTMADLDKYKQKIAGWAETEKQPVEAPPTAKKTMAMINSPAAPGPLSRKSVLHAALSAFEADVNEGESSSNDQDKMRWHQVTGAAAAAAGYVPLSIAVDDSDHVVKDAHRLAEKLRQEHNDIGSDDDDYDDDDSDESDIFGSVSSSSEDDEPNQEQLDESQAFRTRLLSKDARSLNESEASSSSSSSDEGPGESWQQMMMQTAYTYKDRDSCNDDGDVPGAAVAVVFQGEEQQFQQSYKKMSAVLNNKNYNIAAATNNILSNYSKFADMNLGASDYMAAAAEDRAAMGDRQLFFEHPAIPDEGRSRGGGGGGDDADTVPVRVSRVAKGWGQVGPRVRWGDPKIGDRRNYYESDYGHDGGGRNRAAENYDNNGHHGRYHASNNQSVIDPPSKRPLNRESRNIMSAKFKTKKSVGAVKAARKLQNGVASSAPKKHCPKVKLAKEEDYTQKLLDFKVHNNRNLKMMAQQGKAPVGVAPVRKKRLVAVKKKKKKNVIFNSDDSKMNKTNGIKISSGNIYNNSGSKSISSDSGTELKPILRRPKSSAGGGFYESNKQQVVAVPYPPPNKHKSAARLTSTTLQEDDISSTAAVAAAAASMAMVGQPTGDLFQKRRYIADRTDNDSRKDSIQGGTDDVASFYSENELVPGGYSDRNRDKY